MREATSGGEDSAIAGNGCCGRRSRDILALARGIAAAATAAAVAAGLLAAAIVMTGHSALWMAVGAGILVGHGVRLFGKGDGFSRGIVGAALTFACCLAGNLLASEITAARHEGVRLADVVFRNGPGAASAMIRNALRPACLAFHAFAVAIGYVVVREERFDQSLLRLMARYRR